MQSLRLVCECAQAAKVGDAIVRDQWESGTLKGTLGNHGVRESWESLRWGKRGGRWGLDIRSLLGGI